MYRCTLRSTQKLHSRSLLSKSKVGNGVIKRPNSTNSSGGGTGFYVGASIATVGGLIGGATAYAGQSAEFRRTVEDAVPFGKSIFDLVHGEIPAKKKLATPVEVDLSIPFVPEVLKEENVPTQQASINNEEAFSNENISVDTAPVVTFESNTNEDSVKLPETESEIDAAPEKIIEEIVGAVFDDSEIEAQPEVLVESNAEETISTSVLSLDGDEVVPSSMEKESLTEEEIDNLAKLVDRESLELLLSVSQSSIQLLSDKTTQSHKDAVSALRQYMKAFATAMSLTTQSEGFEDKVKELVTIEHEAQTLMDAAKQCELQLLSELNSLHHLVNKIREDPTNTTNEVTEAAEKVAEENEGHLQKALHTVESAQKDFDFLLRFQEFVSESPEELQQELKLFSSDLLDLISGKEELNLSSLPYNQAVLALALKRQQLYGDTTRQAVGMDDAQVEELLAKQKEKLEQLAAERITLELKQMEDEKNLEREQKIKELGENYEREMLSQLKRQASAHTEHLAEKLAGQAKNLDQQHRTELEVKLHEQQRVYYRELEKKVKSISAIQGKISDVVDVETRQRNTQELWIASQALNGTLDVTTFNGRTRTLMPEVISILQLVERNETLTEIVDSFPEQAVLFGVVPEKDLLQRFKRVKASCKRVAAVGDGDSLLKYVLSYVKSVFVVSRWYLTDVAEAVDVDKLTCYEILAKAEHFIEEGDLDTAAKLMSQLKGVARKLSGDWLNEVRLLLETKQTALLLQAYAASLAAGLE